MLLRVDPLYAFRPGNRVTLTTPFCPALSASAAFSLRALASAWAFASMTASSFCKSARICLASSDGAAIAGAKHNAVTRRAALDLGIGDLGVESRVRDPSQKASTKW